MAWHAWASSVYAGLGPKSHVVGYIKEILLSTLLFDMFVDKSRQSGPHSRDVSANAQSWKIRLHLSYFQERLRLLTKISLLLFSIISAILTSCPSRKVPIGIFQWQWHNCLSLFQLVACDTAILTSRQPVEDPRRSTGSLGESEFSGSRINFCPIRSGRTASRCGAGSSYALA